jgi:hypothetical protein
MGTFLGMRGTGDWETDQRPKSWRETILRLYPNGAAPLTGITSKLGSEKVDDPEFNWWEESLPRQGGTCNIYTDKDLSVEYVYATHATLYGCLLGTVYAKVTAAVAGEFAPGMMVVLRDADRPTVDVVGKVVSVAINGDSSYVCVTLLEADDNGGATYNLATADTILVAGSVNPEFGEIPSALSYTPTKYTNYTQIQRTSLEISRTALLTKYRTGDAYQNLKKQITERHAVEIEKQLLFGIPYEGTGANGKPERTSAGLFYAIKTYNSTGVLDWRYEAGGAYAWASTTNGAKSWFDSALEVAFRYGDGEKLAFLGSGALKGINDLAAAYGTINLTPTTEAYGLKVLKWITPFGVLDLMTHPLFTHETTLRNTMLIIEPRRLKWRYITDTTFYPDPHRDKKLADPSKYDGIKEEFLTEGGLEWSHTETMAILNGVGSVGVS